MGCNIPRPWRRPPTPPKVVRIDTCVSKPRTVQMTNCPNCCAPITKCYCEYCGTVFRQDVVLLAGVPKKDELESIKTQYFSDNKIVYAFEKFHSVAHNLGNPTDKEEI